MQAHTYRLMASAAALTMAGLAHAGECPADKLAANELPGAATSWAPSTGGRTPAASLWS